MTIYLGTIRCVQDAYRRIAMIFLALLFLPSQASGQSLPKIRMAYTSIAIQFTPVYLMKEFDLRRKQGLDLEILMIPVISRAVQAAFAGELHFIPAAVSLTSTPIWLLRRCQRGRSLQ